MDDHIRDRNSCFIYYNNHDVKIHVFVGGYGSGKSEISVNTAFFLKHLHPSETGRIALADLDIINPFYRSADVRKELENQDITLITSIFTNTNAEVPAIPQEILSVFDQPLIRAVLDIGGEEAGARIVSCLSAHLDKHPHSIYYVINMNRPFSDSRENISEHIKSLATQHNLKPSGLINNTNLLESTDIEQLLETNHTIQSIGESLGIPLVFCTGLDNQYPSEWGNTAPDGVMFFRMKRYIQYQ